MAQHLRVLAAFAGYRNLVPRTLAGCCSELVVILADPEDPMSSFDLCGHPHTCTYFPHKYTQIKIE